MAHADQPGARRRAPGVRRRRRRQVLQLRQLLRGLRALRGAARPAAPLDARPAAGARGQAQGQPRALALLLLRRVLGAVPQGGRARRDDDEHAPLAHVQVRLQRPQRACSTARRRWEIIAIVIAAILTGIGFVLFGVSNGGSFSVYDGENAFLPSHYVHRFDWTMATVLVVLLGINVAPHVALRDGRLGAPASARTSPPCRSCRTTSSRSPSTGSASASARGRCTWRSC